MPANAQKQSEATSSIFSKTTRLTARAESSSPDWLRKYALVRSPSLEGRMTFMALPARMSPAARRQGIGTNREASSRHRQTMTPV
jgi:hypothetical protein